MDRSTDRSTIRTTDLDEYRYTVTLPLFCCYLPGITEWSLLTHLHEKVKLQCIEEGNRLKFLSASRLCCYIAEFISRSAQTQMIDYIAKHASTNLGQF